MIIKGKYNAAKVFTEQIEDCAVEQIKAMCDFAAFKGLKIRIMPDVHAGAGCTIGTAMTIKDKIVPNMVGVDIGCGMELARLENDDVDLCALDEFIHKNIPAGMNVRATAHAYAQKTDIENLRCREHVKIANAYKSIGTLGGGNHFIEVDRDEGGAYYLVIHSGSRHLGLEVAGYYQNLAYDTLCGRSAEQIKAAISALKSSGRKKEIEKTVQLIKSKTTDIPRDMAYLTGKDFENYLHDMKIVQQFASLNRKAILDDIVNGLNLKVAGGFTTIHNYIDVENKILRKGAVSARKGEKLLIPVNMRDGSLICTGTGNADWNFSAPHGAGRLLSRGKAFATLSLAEFKKQMAGIYSTSVTENTLDESPMAYKSIDNLLENISPSVKVEKIIKPVYNFKSAESACRRR